MRRPGHVALPAALARLLDDQLEALDAMKGQVEREIIEIGVAVMAAAGIETIDHHLFHRRRAQRPGLVKAARKEAQKKRGLVVRFRIVSTPLDLLERTAGRA